MGDGVTFGASRGSRLLHLRAALVLDGLGAACLLVVLARYGLTETRTTLSCAPPTVSAAPSWLWLLTLMLFAVATALAWFARGRKVLHTSLTARVQWASAGAFAVTFVLAGAAHFQEWTFNCTTLGR